MRKKMRLKWQQVKKIFNRFLKFTHNSIKGYVMELVPHTRVIFFTNMLCRRMVSITKEWMGEEISGDSYELNELDPHMIEWEKKNIPRIQKNIAEYEENLRNATVDKTQDDRI